MYINTFGELLQRHSEQHKMHMQSHLIRSMTFLMKKNRMIRLILFFQGIFDPINENVMKVIYSSALTCSSRSNHQRETTIHTQFFQSNSGSEDVTTYLKIK